LDLGDGWPFRFSSFSNDLSQESGSPPHLRFLHIAMQCMAPQPLRDQAFKAILGSVSPSSNCVDDDRSTSAGSSERGTSPSQDNLGSPCSGESRVTIDFLGQVPGYLPPPPGLVLPASMAPPGLEHPMMPAPPGLEDVWQALESLNSSPLIVLPPGLTHEYSPKTFRKELTAILRELASSRNVAAAVRGVRVQKVPKKRQAAEFTDILTRAAEEHRGIARRLDFAFAAGLGAGSSSCFERSQCLSGLQNFFSEVYDDLCEEIPRLPIMVRSELVPTLRSVLPSELLDTVLPVDLRIA